MVKFLLTIFIFLSLSNAQEIIEVEEVVENDIFINKIENFIGSEQYIKNKAYIDILFSPRSDYFYGEVIDSVKIIETLKENGLINLFYKKPKILELNFKTSGSPLFFIKIMSNTLRNIGYYRYVTKESTLNNREFTWSISLLSEYATDPTILQNELIKNGCKIVDIEKNNIINWTYTIDMRDAHLNVDILETGSKLKLKRSSYAHWLDVSNITRVEIRSSRRDNWYPKISYYDSSLHLLQVIAKDYRKTRLSLNIPRDAKYIKISDIYTLKNIKDTLTLIASGSK